MYWESRGRSVRIGNSFARDSTQPQCTQNDAQRIQTFTKPLTHYRATHQCPCLLMFQSVVISQCSNCFVIPTREQIGQARVFAFLYLNNILSLRSYCTGYNRTDILSSRILKTTLFYFSNLEKKYLNNCSHECISFSVQN